MKRSHPGNVVAREPLIRPGIVPNIPNAISLFRLLATPVLLILVIMGRERQFRWLLVVSLVSDIADGLIARALKITSKTGALLDSTADILVSGIGVYGVVTFRSESLIEHYGPVLFVIVLYLASAVGGLLRYGRLASFHTFACRIAAYAQGIFVVVLLFGGFEPFLFYLMVVVSSIAYIEELMLLWLLPTWSADVGGLYRVVRNGRP